MKLIWSILLIAFVAFVCCESENESSSNESSVPSNAEEPLQSGEEGDISKIQT